MTRRPAVAALATWLRKRLDDGAEDDRRGAPRMGIGARGVIVPLGAEGRPVVRRRRDIVLVDISSSGARAVGNVFLDPGPVEVWVEGEERLVVRGELIACDRHERREKLFILRIQFLEKP